MKGAQIKYSAQELAWIEQNKTLTRRDAHAAFCKAFDRYELTFDNFKALCTRKGWKTGRTGRIEVGHVPVNKGKKCEPGKGGLHPNARAHQFRRGERTGIAVDLYKPIGTERMSKDGYLERKIHDGMPLQSRWRAVHLVNWEAVNGPIPKSHALKSIDGDRGNTDAANWALIPRALLPRLNGRYGLSYDQASPEVKPTIMAIAKVKHAAKQVKNKGGQA